MSRNKSLTKDYQTASEMFHDSGAELLSSALEWDGDDDTSIAIKVDLFIVADYLGINSLRNYLLLQLEEILDEKAQDVQKTFGSDETVEKLDNGVLGKDFMDQFSHAVDVAWNTSLNDLRKPVNDFVGKTRFALFHGGHIWDHLEDGFEKDMLKLVFTKNYPGPILPLLLPVRCHRCKRARSYFPNTYVEGHLLSSAKFRAFCESCHLDGLELAEGEEAAAAAGGQGGNEATQ